ncbi:ABC-2 transporter permease [Streptomyces sp. NPDC101234]|uniref:ABC-2 transporter permease n=1 Tax=Streptomyces sp. NPDC101234 TaxID=3366138 RepID=UPI00380ED129
MTASVRVAVLNLRTVAPYRRQIVLTPLLVVAIMYNRPEVVVPGLTMLCASTTASYPFMVSERADLETLYAVLPLTRRSLVLGHYLWALAIFAVTAGLGAPAALILAQQQHIAFTGHTVATVVTVSWAAFTLAVSIQFPLFIRFGFTRAGLLATTLPISVVAVAATRLHMHITPDATVLALLTASGAALLAASAAASTALDPRRTGAPASS